MERTVQPLTVSQLTRQITNALASTFSDVRVEGEVSGFKAHSSGHWYFTLKDDNAVVSCAMFRGNNQRYRPPREGDRIIAIGKIDVYAPRGGYSLILRDLQIAGVGDLLRRLEALKQRLADEGLFDLERKRPLPAFPMAIGVATSPTGAAFRDVLRVIHQRFPGVTIYLAPCRVQGDGAAAEIARAVALLNAHGRSSVLIVGRGGGSIEDLWAFNEEVVVRAVAASKIPIVSAVGHEVDTSLSDLAADVRAATPSHAAELVTPVRSELVSWVDDQQQRLQRALTRLIRARREHLKRLRPMHPRQRLEWGQRRVDDLEERLLLAIQRRARGGRDRLSSAATRLNALSPLAILQRGFSLTTTEGGQIVRRAGDVQVGQALRVTVGEGSLGVRVEAVKA